MTIESRLDANIFNFYSLPSGHSLERRSALSLLSPNRLDIVARYIFVRQYMLGWGISWGTRVYRELLESSTPTFADGDGRKTSFTDYLSNLAGLATSMSREGYDVSRGLIPYVGNTVVDGAHRVAAAIHFGHDVEAVRVQGPPQVMDASSLLTFGLSETTVDNLACEYARLDKGTFVAVLFPSTQRQWAEALDLIRSNAEIVHQREIALTDVGRRNLIKLLYGHEPWWDGSHTEQFVDLRFPRGGGVAAVLFKTRNGAHSRPVKQFARKAFPADHYVHMNDTHQETVWIMDALFNRNGRSYINQAEASSTPRFAEFEQRFRLLRDSRPELEYACIDSGGVLAAFGLRDSNDLDFIVPTRQMALSLHDLPEGMDCHNDEYGAFHVPVDDIIASPHHHFRYKGVMMMGLDSVMLFKKWRNGEKDRQDIRLIVGMTSATETVALSMADRSWLVAQKSRSAIIRFRNRATGWMVLRMKRILPAAVYSSLRSMYHRIGGSG